MYTRYEGLAARRGMTNYAVAKATGIGQDTLSRWKNGKGEPSVETLQTLADFFEVSLDYLCGREETKKKKRLGREAEELGPVYFSLAIQMKESGIDPGDIEYFIGLHKRAQKTLEERKKKNDKG